MAGRTCLILGGSGFLGFHLTALAAKEFGRVVCASRRAGEARGRLETGVPTKSERDELRSVQLREWDAREESATRTLFEAVEPTVVFLAAALARPAACEEDAALAHELNVELPATVARLCAERGARLAHVSTDLVFGAPAAGPSGPTERYSEADEPSPLHAYGRSKAAGEVRVLAEDPAALVVRLPLLYGDSFGRELGPTDALLAAIARGERPALFTDEWRTPLDVRVAAVALLELARLDVRGVLHVAGSDRMSRLELGRAQLAAHGFAPERIESSVLAVTRAELGVTGSRVRDASLDSSRARSFLKTDLTGPLSTA